jgi:transcriptional regulator with XRE-family HTH domain
LQYKFGLSTESVAIFALMKVIKINLNFVVNNRIRELRAERNLNQKYVAGMLNISVAAYSKLENGHNDFSMARVAEIAKVLNIDLIYLLAAGHEHQQADLLNHKRMLREKDMEIERLKQKILRLEAELDELINN